MAKPAGKPAEEAARGLVGLYTPLTPPPPARAIKWRNIPCSGAADTWNNVVIDVSFEWRRHMPLGGGQWERGGGELGGSGGGEPSRTDVHVKPRSMLKNKCTSYKITL